MMSEHTNHNAKSNGGNSSSHNFVKIENPYRPFDLAAGDWIYHEDVTNQIKEIFEFHPENRVVVIQSKPGAGKTSTLQRIEKHPDKLGENYILIYLDSRKFMGLEFEELLRSVFKAIAEKLNKSGYGIAKPGYTRKEDITESTLKSFLLSIDSVLNPDDILVLIFDELDYLLESLEPTIISTLTQYFQNIERTWNNYALILAGDKRLINLTKIEAFNQFLEKANNIDIEEYLEERTIKKLITEPEPIKDHLTYDEEAVQGILYYSGQNLFFQQLICHYLVNYLNKEKRNHCTREDVELVIPKILEEAKEREEFVFAWGKKLSWEGRLIASALADESITEKKGSFYYLRENSLLDTIFAKELESEIKKLQGFGYLNKVQERRLAGSPFKMPLYGEWIRNEHPFMRTVIEHIDAIGDKVGINQLMEEIEKTPENRLTPFNKKEILKIVSKWHDLAKSIKDKRKADHNDQIKDFLENFAGLLKLDINKRECPNTIHSIIDIKNLNIGILDEAFCLVQERPEITQNDISNIERLTMAFAQDTQTKLSLFFYFKKSEMVENLVKKTYLNLIAIEENDFKRIILADVPAVAFRRIILSRLSLQKVSPYQTAGPAKATFYGRMDIINRIIGSPNKSFAIVGARKIGKSSLLLKIKDNPPANTAYIFMDLEVEFANVKNYKTFLKSLESELKDVFKKKISFGGLPFSDNLSRLPGFIQKLASREDKRIVFILDEMDKLLEFDKEYDYKLMRIFRNMSQKNYCQFIFAGFKELYHQKRDINHPAYNFYEEIRLEPLEREASLELITRPMESIGVQYKNEEYRELILEDTACHPNLIQFFCKHLVEKIEKHNKVEEKRSIFRKDIEDVFGTRYEEYIMDEVYMFFSDLSDIDRLILILLAEEFPNKKSFSTEEIRGKLGKNGIKISRNDVYRNLKNLVMRFIILDEGRDKYSFALSVFPDILKNNVDNDYKSNLIKEIKENEQ